MSRRFPELPFGDEMAAVALKWAASYGKYSTDDLKEALAAHYRLTPEQLALTLSDGRNAFSNYVDWVTANMTTRGLHAGKAKLYELTDRGRRAAERVDSGDLQAATEN